jgi:hypothetical protein
MTTSTRVPLEGLARFERRRLYGSAFPGEGRQVLLDLAAARAS